jgi:hypothetical protein
MIGNATFYHGEIKMTDATNGANGANEDPIPLNRSLVPVNTSVVPVDGDEDTPVESRAVVPITQQHREVATIPSQRPGEDRVLILSKRIESWTGREGAEHKSENWEHARAMQAAFERFGITEDQINERAHRIWESEGSVDDLGASTFRHHVIALTQLVAEAEAAEANRAATPPTPPPPPETPRRAARPEPEEEPRRRGGKGKIIAAGVIAAVIAGVTIGNWASNDNKAPAKAPTAAADTAKTNVVLPAEPAYPSMAALMENVRRSAVYDFKHTHQSVLDKDDINKGNGGPRIMADQNGDKVLVVSLAWMKAQSAETRRAVFQSAASREAGVGGYIPVANPNAPASSTPVANTTDAPAPSTAVPRANDKTWYDQAEGRTDIVIPTIFFADPARTAYIEQVYGKFANDAKPNQLLVFFNTATEGDRAGGLTDHYVFQDRSQEPKTMKLVYHPEPIAAAK